MRRRLLHGPLLLFLYQAVPVSVTPDSLARHRLTVGFGGGRWENEQFSCNGDLLSALRVPYSSGGVQYDAWATPQIRIGGFGGSYQSRPDGAPSAVRDYDGPFFGGQVAYEWKSVGIGAGFAHVAGADGFTSPSGYLRFGTLDGVHIRADLFPPTPVLGSTGWLRAGVGYRDGRRRRAGGFLGLAIPPAYSQKGMFTGYLHVPVARHVELQVDGIIGPGEQYSQQGAAVAVRYEFGSH
jgi:hypothetical protein